MRPQKNNYDWDRPARPSFRSRENALTTHAPPSPSVQVRLDIIDIDHYKRMVGVIWIGTRNINLEMVKEGYAEAYLEYLKEPYRAQFIQAGKEARTARRGIWSLSGYERPSNFRRRLKVRR